MCLYSSGGACRQLKAHQASYIHHGNQKRWKDEETDLEGAQQECESAEGREAGDSIFVHILLPAGNETIFQGIQNSQRDIVEEENTVHLDSCHFTTIKAVLSLQNFLGNI